MAIKSTTIRFQTTTNGYAEGLSPAAGELWYADFAYVYQHGDGNGSNYVFGRAESFDDTIGNDGGTPNVKIQDSNSTNTSTKYHTATFGQYVAEGERVQLRIPETDGGTVTALLQLRRIL